MNTDGVKIFNSSKRSFWPVYFIINELPPKMRFRLENMLIGGVWCSFQKPFMSLFLKRICEALKNLCLFGMQVHSPHFSSPFTSKIMLLSGTFDLPARASVLNMKQFNAFYACVKCTQPGKTYHSGPRAHSHVWPFIKSDPTGPKRTHQQFIANGIEASRSHNHIAGIVGITPLAMVHSYNVIQGTAIDHMHGIFLGVIRNLLSLWFQSDHHKEPYYLGKSTNIISQLLLSSKPPCEFSRCPRSISERKDWKASEYRMFLLYYTPILEGILPSVYFEHLELSVQAIYILLSMNISENQITAAERFLTNFVHRYANLYGEQHMNMNVHNLLHYADSVRELGPLWTTSLFPFESFNGQVRRFIHGTRGIGEQAIQCVQIMQKNIKGKKWKEMKR